MESVKSGNTTRAIEELNTWYKNEVNSWIMKENTNNRNYVNEFGDWDWGFSKEVLENILVARRQIPFKQFLVRYLTELYSEDLNKLDFQGCENQAGFITTILKELNQDELKYKKASKPLQTLVDLLVEDFASNQLDDHKKKKIRKSFNSDKEFYSKDNIIKLIFTDSITENTLFLLAFGLNMPYEDLSFFLRKALLRADLNVWNPSEFILFLTFKYNQDNRLDFYQLCKKEFEVVDDDLKYNWTDSNNNINTAVVKNKIEALIKDFNEHYESIGITPGGELSNSVIDLLKKYKGLINTNTDYVRTAAKESKRMLAEFKEGYKEQMNSFKKADALKDDYYAKGMVQVYYDPKNGLEIPANTLFYRIDKSGKTVSYKNKKEVSILPAEHLVVDVEVPVQCIQATKYKDKAEDLIGYVPKNSSFEVVKNEELKNCIDKIYNKSYFKISSKVDQNQDIFVKGKVQIKCDAGITIPGDTLFLSENGFYFASTKTIDTAIYEEVFVTCTEINEDAVINTIHDCNIPNWQNKFISISNTKIGKIQKENNETKGVMDGYLYHEDENISEYEEIIDNKYFQELQKALKNTKLDKTKIYNIEHEKANITRNDLITLSFLSYLAKKEVPSVSNQAYLAFIDKKVKTIDEMLDKKHNDFLNDIRYELTELQSHLGGFIQQTNELLSKCGFYELYSPNPYDSIIISLITSQEAVEGFRNMWTWVLSKEGEKNGR